MPINVKCPGCGSKFHAPQEAAGKRSKCPRCQTIIEIQETQMQECVLPTAVDISRLSEELSTNSAAVAILQNRTRPFKKTKQKRLIYFGAIVVILSAVLGGIILACGNSEYNRDKKEILRYINESSLRDYTNLDYTNLCILGQLWASSRTSGRFQKPAIHTICRQTY